MLILRKTLIIKKESRMATIGAGLFGITEFYTKHYSNHAIKERDVNWEGKNARIMKDKEVNLGGNL
jgi:hypothetical protein